MEDLSKVIGTYMSKTVGLKEHCDRCLRTGRWGGSVVLMVVDAAFTSIGLNYFTSVVPKVMEFKQKLVDSGRLRSLEQLNALSLDQVQNIWRNSRSWQVARAAASYLHNLATTENLDEREALRCWATNSCLEGWEENPVGSINGVGITTFQYLRMMGGVDTAMPDKIVRRVIRQILDEASVEMPTGGDIELVTTIEQMSKISGYRPIEICWMTWLIQPEGHMIRMDKYQHLLDRI
jgi:hypothetical protein